jgi:hypothetical protein
MTQIPDPARSWQFSVNNRIGFTSLNATMAAYLFGLKNFLVGTMGYAVKYTCDGTTGPSSSSDHTDRWTDATKTTTRGSTSGSAQSFAVLTDGDGVDFMLTYQGASDDIARFSYSQGALFTPAGTANQQPTATDEAVALSGTSLINSTASGDRVWHAMATTDRKNWRAFICRGRAVCAAYLALEGYATALISPAAQSPAKVAMGQTFANTFAPSAAVVGVCRLHGSADATASLLIGRQDGWTTNQYEGFNLELQGGKGCLIRAQSIWSTTASARGKVGNLVDWFVSSDLRVDLAMTDGRKWVHLTGSTSLGSASILWPWDGATQIQGV